MPDTDTMADADTRAAPPPAPGHDEIVAVEVPAWEFRVLTKASSVQDQPVGNFMATAATYMALVRLELFDEIDQHPDVVALLEAIPEKPPRDERDVCATIGQISPEAAAVLNDVPSEAELSAAQARHQARGSVVNVCVDSRQLDLLRRAAFVAEGRVSDYVLHNAAFVAQLRLGVIETIIIPKEEAEWLDALEARPDRDLSSLREFMSRPSPFVESWASATANLVP